jgi:hypothetical protein
MKRNRSSVSLSSAPKLLGEDTLESNRRNVVRRRSFLQGIGAAAATLPATALFAAEKPDDDHGDRALTRGNVAIVRLAAAIELIEADLWQQYNELGGAPRHSISHSLSRAVRVFIRYSRLKQPA